MRHQTNSVYKHVQVTTPPFRRLFAELLRARSHRAPCAAPRCTAMRHHRAVSAAGAGDAQQQHGGAGGDGRLLVQLPEAEAADGLRVTILSAWKNEARCHKSMSGSSVSARVRLLSRWFPGRGMAHICSECVG